jgi:hypothetical protein
VKAGGKQRNLLAETSDYVENRREMVDSKSVSVGSPVGHNESPVPIGSHTQPSEPIADENRITIVALKRAGYISLGKDRREVVRAL